MIPSWKRPTGIIKNKLHTLACAGQTVACELDNMANRGKGMWIICVRCLVLPEILLGPQTALPYRLAARCLLGHATKRRDGGGSSSPALRRHFLLVQVILNAVLSNTRGPLRP